MGASNSKMDTDTGGGDGEVEMGPMRIVTLGRPWSGKSRLIHRLQHMFGKPREEDAYVSNHYFEHDSMELNVLDYDGRNHYDYDSKFYIRGSCGIIYMIDSADIRFVKGGVQFLGVILEDESICNTTIMVCANKQDLEGAVGPKVVEDEIKQNYKVKRGNTLFVMPTSVTNKDDDSLEIALRYMFKTLKRKARGKIQTGLIPRAWKKAKKVAEDSDGEDQDGRIKFLLKDPVHMFKSLLIR